MVEDLELNALLVTRSEKGMMLLEAGSEPVFLSTQAREVYDVTGAGDTVIAVYTAALAAGAPFAAAADLANHAAGLAVRELGTATVTAAQLDAAGKRTDAARHELAAVGADLVLELGGGGTMGKSMEAAKINGRISLVGVLTGFDGQINPLPILRKSLAVNGIYVGSRDMQEQFHRALETNKIHPVIDRVFKFEQVKEAYAYMQSARHFGKIVIELKPN